MNTRSLIAKGIAFPITAIALLPLPLFSTPTLTQNPVPCSVVAGSPATLSCLATGATSYQWTKNGLPIPGANDSKLTFDKTNLADSGTYRVIAKDGTGQMISNPAALLITKPWDAPCVFCLNLVEAPPTDSKQVLADEAQKSAATFLGDDKPQVVAGPPPLGHAWDFAQTKGIIKVATSPLLSSIGDVTTTSGLTLAFWFNKAHPARFLRLAGFAPCFEIATGKGFNITFGDGKNMANLDLAFPGELTDGHWHHIAITLDFTRTTDNVALYLDGKKTTHFSRTFDKSFSSRANLIIGGRSAMGDHVMQAQLAQFALFNHGLDESEVDDLFKTGTVHSYSPIVKVLPNSNRVVLPQNQLTILGDISGPPSSPSQGNWSKVSGPGAVTFSDAGRPSTIASFSVAGDYLLRFSLPSVPHSITRDIAIKVASNEPPVALASVNHSKVSLVPTSVKLTGGGTDDGLPENPGRLSYLWTQVSGPGSATFAAPTDEITTASLPQSAPGDYVFRLTANDGETANSTEVHVAVVSNLPPVATAISSRPIIDFTEGAANTFDLGCRANDDGFPAKPGRLSYSWSALGENAASLSFDKPDQPNVQATAKAPGTYQVRVAVSDGELSTTANVWLKAVPASVSKFVHSPDYVEPFSSNPPPFVHPRLFFTEEDRAALAEKAKNDPLIAQSVKQMEEVIKTSIDDPTSIVGQAYAQFATGNYHYDFRALYPSLENPVSLSGAKGDIYTALSAACYLAWLDQSDPKKLRELATVVANLARCHALVFVPNQRRTRIITGALITRYSLISAFVMT